MNVIVCHKLMKFGKSLNTLHILVGKLKEFIYLRSCCSFDGLTHFKFWLGPARPKPGQPIRSNEEPREGVHPAALDDKIYKSHT